MRLASRATAIVEVATIEASAHVASKVFMMVSFVFINQHRYVKRGLDFVCEATLAVVFSRGDRICRVSDNPGAERQDSNQEPDCRRDPSSPRNPSNPKKSPDTGVRSGTDRRR